MFHAKLFSTCSKYRSEHFPDGQYALLQEGGPLIVQFCANDPQILLAAAKLVEADTAVSAIDLNLGCPQDIARRGHYGSYLQNEWPLIHTMLSTLVAHVDKPITAKIRVFENVEKTIAYAKMIQSTGISLLTVHGRLQRQKGHLTGLADWEQIRQVK